MLTTVAIGSGVCALTGHLLLHVFSIDIPHFRFRRRIDRAP